jgi:hypothetical protein
MRRVELTLTARQRYRRKKKAETDAVLRRMTMTSLSPKLAKFFGVPTIEFLARKKIKETPRGERPRPAAKQFERN